MSKLISELLGADEPTFSLSIRQLEKMSGRPSVDIRLAEKIANKVKQKTKELGFDPKDTTGSELYHGLMTQIKEDDEHLAKLIGATDPAEVTAELLKNAAATAKVPKKVWVIKKSVAKDFLRKSPPPVIMNRLRYKSVDSMLKTENIIEIYGALRFAETADWLKKFNNNYKSLTPSDFEQRDIEIMVLPSERWGDLSTPFTTQKLHNVTHSKEIGAIYLLPAKKAIGQAITVLPLIFHYINEIRLYSTFFKLNQVKKDFGKIVAETLNVDPKDTANLAGQSIHWRTIQRYYGKNDDDNHPEIFEPHVQSEDLIWRQAEKQLANLDRRFKWWQGLDYVGVLDNGSPVSLNLMDAAICYSNNLVFDDRVFYHLKESLWNELFARYMGENILEQQILKTLDAQTPIKETIHNNLYKGVA